MQNSTLTRFVTDPKQSNALENKKKQNIINKHLSKSMPNRNKLKENPRQIIKKSQLGSMANHKKQSKIIKNQQKSRKVVSKVSVGIVLGTI